MTPEARARKFAFSNPIVDLGSAEGIRITAAAIREAVTAERERVKSALTETMATEKTWHGEYFEGRCAGMEHAIEVIEEEPNA